MLKHFPISLLLTLMAAGAIIASLAQLRGASNNNPLALSNSSIGKENHFVVAAEPQQVERVVQKSVDAGQYWQYVPQQLSRPRKVLVICHGMFHQTSSAKATAKTFLQRWIPLAEQLGVVVVAPIFNDENYGTLNAPGGWGYRALIGRHTNADQFLIQIADHYQALDPTYDGKMYLYGHSAGGQFVNRFLVMHPERVQKAVISAAKWYAMPDSGATWPIGMAPRQRRFNWGSTHKQVRIIPDPSSWVTASELPVTVIVGGRDTQQFKRAFNQGGTTRIERGHHWVNQMNELAQANGKIGQYNFILVPGIGHNSKQLTPTSIKAFLPLK